MKVLIWFLCILANAVITTIIKNAGVILGAIPTMILFGATLWLAQILCKKWDEHKENKAFEQYISDQAVPTAPVNITEQVSFCGNCGEKLIDNSQFCRKCGTKVEMTPKLNKATENAAVLQSHHITPPVAGGWACTCGRNHAAYESSCVCGVTKSAIIAMRNQEQQNDMPT